MALAINNGYPRVDVESLLFDLKDILRTSLQVHKTHSEQIVRLGGKPINDLVAAEYTERAHVALAQVDAALDLFESSESFETASTQYESFNIAAWIENTNKSLGLLFESPEAVPITVSSVVPASTPSTQDIIPNDFWNVHEFKWEDEPLSDDGSDDLVVKKDADALPMALVPDENIPELWLDGGSSDGSDSDHSSTTPRASSNFDDSATLYHPEDISPYASHRRRHTLVGHKLASFDSVPASLHIFTTPTTAASPPTRPFGLVRTSSAPDLRALRGPHTIFEDEERMLLSAF